MKLCYNTFAKLLQGFIYQYNLKKGFIQYHEFTREKNPTFYSNNSPFLLLPHRPYARHPSIGPSSSQIHMERHLFDASLSFASISFSA